MAFDKDYWDAHWQRAGDDGGGYEVAPNPYLARELRALVPGTALDAGCGEGAEAIWLANEGWQVTAADISPEVLARARDRAERAGAAPARVEWVEADLSAWVPREPLDLVTTHYAHPAMLQLKFYERLAEWVAPRGTLLIVGHRHTEDTTGHGHHPPDEVSVTAAGITAGLDPARWDVVTADEPVRTLTNRDGRPTELRDVVVRATRRP